MNKRDITDIEDIKILVNNFYTKVREDELLKNIFENIIQDRWPQHLEKMYRFWQTVLLSEHTYTGSPFMPHAKMPVNKEHFDRWIMLFSETVDEHFVGTKADEAKWRGGKMAEMFLYKIQYIQQNPNQVIL